MEGKEGVEQEGSREARRGWHIMSCVLFDIPVRSILISQMCPLDMGHFISTLVGETTPKFHRAVTKVLSISSSISSSPSPLLDS